MGLSSPRLLDFPSIKKIIWNICKCSSQEHYRGRSQWATNSFSLYLKTRHVQKVFSSPQQSQLIDSDLEFKSQFPFKLCFTLPIFKSRFEQFSLCGEEANEKFKKLSFWHHFSIYSVSLLLFKSIPSWTLSEQWGGEQRGQLLMSAFEVCRSACWNKLDEKEFCGISKKSTRESHEQIRKSTAQNDSLAEYFTEEFSLGWGSGEDTKVPTYFQL